MMVGAVAQSEECNVSNVEAPGSKPGSSTMHCNTYTYTLQSKHAGAGSTPVRDIYVYTLARLAQMVERMTLNHVVAGSIPAVGVKSQWNNLWYITMLRR